ncbi:MAG: lipocalin family protein [Muribaculaceae bacterium]|nr:lipocalin family protein [Muribaculaceae bacterium]
MAAKAIFKTLCGVMAAVTLTACENNGIEGTWVEPVPGMEEMVQGFCLEKGGKASSVNMATLQYETWSQSGDKLILTGKSIGNHTTIEFADTLVIEQMTDSTLTLVRDRMTVNYRRQ